MPLCLDLNVCTEVQQKNSNKTYLRTFIRFYLMFIFLTAISMQFLYFPMPVFYRYNFLTMNLQLT